MDVMYCMDYGYSTNMANFFLVVDKDSSELIYLHQSLKQDEDRTLMTIFLVVDRESSELTYSLQIFGTG